MSEAYTASKLKGYSYQPQQEGDGGSGVARRTAVEAGARKRKIPNVISHDDALYFATVSGWTHTERWRPSAKDEVRRLRRQRHGEAAVAVKSGDGDEGGDGLRGEGDGCCRWGGWSGAEEARSGIKMKNVGDKVKNFVFGGLESRRNESRDSIDDMKLQKSS